MRSVEETLTVRIPGEETNSGARSKEETEEAALTCSGKSLLMCIALFK